MATQLECLAPDERTDVLRDVVFAAVSGLVRRHGGGRAVFGEQRALAEDAWRKSMVGHAFPDFWFEVPLLGQPGFDLHVYYGREQVRPGERFADGCGFGCQEVFDWYSFREDGGHGVGFAHDLRSGKCATGVYVNFNGRPLHDMPGFLPPRVPAGPQVRCGSL